MKQKTCTSCLETKDEQADFYFVKRSQKFYTSCKVCMLDKAKAYQAERYIPKAIRPPQKPKRLKSTTHKLCKPCNSVKTLEAFGKDCYNYPHSACRDCRLEAARLRREKSPHPRPTSNKHKDVKESYCKGCDQTLPVINFYFGAKTQKYSCYCKSCQKSKNKKNYLKYSDKLSEIRDSKRDELKLRFRRNFVATPEIFYQRALDYNERNREKIRANNKQWIIDNPVEHSAIKAINKEIRAGRIIRPDTCECCGAVPIRKKTSPIHAHHMNYDNPLEVLWLCVSCHRRFHHGDPSIVAKCEVLWSNKLKDILSKNKDV